MQHTRTATATAYNNACVLVEEHTRTAYSRTLGAYLSNPLTAQTF